MIGQGNSSVFSRNIPIMPSTSHWTASVQYSSFTDGAPEETVKYLGVLINTPVSSLLNATFFMMHRCVVQLTSAKFRLPFLIKVHQRRVQLARKSTAFAVRVLGPLSRLPPSVREAPSRNALKERLDNGSINFFFGRS